jgi:glutaredoxin
MATAKVAHFALARSNPPDLGGNSPKNAPLATLRYMEGRRCSVHGLVVGDDGKCVICRRGDADLAPPKTSSDLPIVLFLLVSAVGLAGSGLYWIANQRSDAPAAPAVLVTPEPAATTVQRPSPVVVETAARPTTPVSTAQPVDEPVPAPPEPEELTDEQVEALKRKVPVTMYMTPKCSLCASARAYMKARRYSLRELDIEASATDKVLLESVNPAGSVPTFDVAGRVLVGYDVNILDRAIEEKALKGRRR